MAFSKAKAFSFYFKKKKQKKETNNTLVNVSKHLSEFCITMVIINKSGKHFRCFRH